MEIKRKEFFDPETVYRMVAQRVEELYNEGIPVDYCTFLPMGEPALDKNIGKTIDLLHRLYMKIAIISNASLLHYPKVRSDLLGADCVSVKVDTVVEEGWRLINRPHQSLSLQDILDGIMKFSDEFSGRLITETMVIDGLNHHERIIKPLIDYLDALDPNRIYLATPTRPPSEPHVQAPSGWMLHVVYQYMREHLKKVELLDGNKKGPYRYDDKQFIRSFLDTITVHPMEKQDVRRMFEKARVSWSLIGTLLQKNLITATTYRGKEYYRRNAVESPKKNVLARRNHVSA